MENHELVLRRKHIHTQQKREIMNLERTALVNESWKANEPTIADLLKIERDERNQIITAELASIGKLLALGYDLDELDRDVATSRKFDETTAVYGIFVI